MKRYVRPVVQQQQNDITFDITEYTCRSCGKKYISSGSKYNKKGLCRKKCIRSQKRKSKKLEKRLKSAQNNPKYKIYKNKLSDSFYESRAWLELRSDILIKFGRKCMLCNETDAIFHVDHIKPRSKYPELQLDSNNLQVLCAPCNIGKSNRYEELDLRPKIHECIFENVKCTICGKLELPNF
jgi:5-methylcytosine-specific restriction endonuclease McrA